MSDTLYFITHSLMLLLTILTIPARLQTAHRYSYFIFVQLCTFRLNHRRSSHYTLSRFYCALHFKPVHHLFGARHSIPSALHRTPRFLSIRYRTRFLPIFVITPIPSADTIAYSVGVRATLSLPITDRFTLCLLRN